MVFLCVASFPVSAMAANWVEVSSAVSGAVWSVDADSVKAVDDGYKKNVRKAWIKIDYSKVTSQPAREAKVLFFFDCVGETAKSATWLEYKADGTVLRNITSSYPTYEVVVPETVLSDTMNAICGVTL